jgi:ATP-dependent DNA helicase RecG
VVNSKARAFRKILELERNTGYQNVAVTGGLDGFLSQWQADAKDKPGSRFILISLAENKLFAIPYVELTPNRRESWVSIAITCLSNNKATNKDSPSLSLDKPANALVSVTSRVAPALKRLGIETIGDLLLLYPRRLNYVRQVKDLRLDEEQTVLAKLRHVKQVRLGKSMMGTEGVVGDNTGDIRVVWFNQSYLARSLKPHNDYVLSGRVTMRGRRRVLESPQYEEVRTGEGLTNLTRTGRLFPVYPGTEGVTQQSLRRIVREALNKAVGNIQEILPYDVRHRHQLLPIGRAIWEAHYPSGEKSREEARRRLAFDELLKIQLAVLSRRQAMASKTGSHILNPPTGMLEGFLARLPFQLTQAQSRVINEILDDVSIPGKTMTRLIQGDVGSGKTVVALAGLLAAAASGYQAAIMAPTEVLAEQHFMTIAKLLEGIARHDKSKNLLSVHIPQVSCEITVGILTGSMPASGKKRVRDMLADGSIDIIIGTHALIQDQVDIPRLALAVIDEQHRFGVLQRAALRRHGTTPHMLIMSATPIPRTLALTLYGDLDLSTIDQLPPSRQTIKTWWLQPEHRRRIYSFIGKQIADGRQVFVVYPLIDESEEINARAAINERERLANDVFPDLRVGLIHGRMSLREKQDVMEGFHNRELDILVSTPVVEVGIDVPNATVMLVEGADRFGLSQLHQFRGRVGRGQHISYCFLIAESPSEEAKQRLAAMELIEDGFQLAEKDLSLRGPGEYFGTRQSGLPDLRMARLTDSDLLALARKEAQNILESDSHLAAPEHLQLKQSLNNFTARIGDVG